MDRIYCEIEEITSEIIEKVRVGEASATVHTKRMSKWNSGNMVARRKFVTYYVDSGKIATKEEFRIQMHDGTCWKSLTNELAKLFDPESYEERMQRKAENKRGAEKHNYKIGDIFYSLWGYEQTNSEFYEVVKVTPHTVTVREICSNCEPTGFLQYRITPKRGCYLNESYHIDNNYEGKSCRVNRYGSIKINDVISASPWGGKPVSISRYA